MAEVRFRISDDKYEQLENMAHKEGLSVQEFCKMKIFNESTIYTALEFIRRAKAKYAVGDTFTVPDVYGEDWNLPNGPAGAFGKTVNLYLQDHMDEGIKFVDFEEKTNRARYTRTI